MMGLMKPPAEYGEQRAPAMVELLDGSWLGVFEADETAILQLETWALVPDERSHEPSRAGGLWTDALAAGPLLQATFTGIVSPAAWSAFPAAARFVVGRSRAASPATSVRAQVRTAAELAFGVPAATGLVVSEVHQDADGTWLGTFGLASGEIGSARASPDGAFIRLTLDSLAT
jgi:hypothetical protein